MTTTQAQIADTAYINGFLDCQRGRTDLYAALTAAAEVRPADISCPLCGGQNGQHDHNCGLKKTAAAEITENDLQFAKHGPTGMEDIALRDFIADTPISEPNDGWAAEVDNRSATELANVLTKMEMQERNATIERCAQVVNGYLIQFQKDFAPHERVDCTFMVGRIAALVAAIRALKDKP